MIGIMGQMADGRRHFGFLKISGSKYRAQE
jgi:hypothetical protein